MEWTMAPDGMAAAARKVITGLLESGREAYFVGGCIRDELLGRPVHDIDLTTSALPEEVMAVFPRCVPTGLAHGTVTVLQDGFSFEVTTYRTESGYADHRRPEHVSFVSDVKEDLRRRDFTINAICCGLDGELVDPFLGAQDLSARLIRCVGSAEERFDEDALRMLRCVRFASVLDFAVAKNTWRGLLRQRDKLAHIAVERVRAETERIVEGPHPVRGLGLLARSGLLARGKARSPGPAKICGSSRHTGRDRGTGQRPPAVGAAPPCPGAVGRSGRQAPAGMDVPGGGAQLRRRRAP
ncbi:CCA tRNA nucleotidyltransferase, partial [Paenibacillus sp. DMB5]|uniref:CCA tRNA nucleotidyltransferase n=1 Tax=Paenibacillus sp. DMB5 TaxID=1780103 RepID=UPI000A5D2E06